LRAAGFLSTSGASFSRQAKKTSRMLAFSSLNSSEVAEDDEQYSSNTINVLATKTEASMSSTSFAIPRRSTIDADVSLFH
jgi:hypothetical protein